MSLSVPMVLTVLMGQMVPMAQTVQKLLNLQMVLTVLTAQTPC